MAEPSKLVLPFPIDPISADLILDNMVDGVFTIDHGWRISFFNRAAEMITGTSRSEVIGRRCMDVFALGTCQRACALRHTMDTGTEIVHFLESLLDSQGRCIPIWSATATLRDPQGRILGGIKTFRLLEGTKAPLESGEDPQSDDSANFPDGEVDQAGESPSLVRSIPVPAQRLADARNDAEARAICQAIQRNRGNRLAAARELGMHKSTLFRKVQRLGISLPSEDGRSSRAMP